MKHIEGESIKTKALQGGAKEAFAELWRYFYPRLQHFAASFHGLPVSEYEDLVSDIIIKAFRSMDKYNPGYSLSTWVYRIAENHFTDALRKMKRRSSLSIEDLDRKAPERVVSGDGPAEEAADRDLLERCKTAIDTMEGDDKKIAFLKFYESLSSSEIGRILGIPPGTVRWRITMIRSFIGKTLGGFHED